MGLDQSVWAKLFGPQSFSHTFIIFFILSLPHHGTPIKKRYASLVYEILYYTLIRDTFIY
jgi:hypothetical protein